MRAKPRVCLLDEDEHVAMGWRRTLGDDAELIHYRTPALALAAAQRNEQLFPSLSCTIVSRYFPSEHIDSCEASAAADLRAAGMNNIFLNWQGYLTKEEIERNFDGRLFNRYGVRWQTLRSRVQKLKSKSLKSALKLGTSPRRSPDELDEQGDDVPVRASMIEEVDRPERCRRLLRQMAINAAGRHKERLEAFASTDQDKGTALLEAIYNRLSIGQDVSADCPSRYINSSPVVARGILRATLYG